MVKFNSVSNSFLSIIFFIKNKNNDLGGLIFSQDENGNWGYIVEEDGADTVIPFKTRTGNATVSQVLSGKTFSNASSSGLTGTMTNNGAKTASLNCGGSYTIPAGYHNGSGKITANSLASQTSATAKAADILKGKTAWVNGTKLTGTNTNVSLGTKISISAGDTLPGSKTYTTSLNEINIIILYSGQYNSPHMVWVRGLGLVASDAGRYKITNVSGSSFSFSTTYGGWTDGYFYVIGK